MTQVDAEFSVRQLRGRPNIINEMGQLLEQHENVLLDEVRLQEALPVKETKVFVVSLDGANVRLNMPGKKKGRPTERPKDEDAMSRETPSCFKNAMVGVCGLYGEVPQNTGSDASTNALTPQRLYGNCTARMGYKRFRDKGWPIGSGPVEGACKNIVKQRMCRSGMRWSIPGGQTILTLRAIVKSQRWQTFWTACKKLNKLPELSQST